MYLRSEVSTLVAVGMSRSPEGRRCLLCVETCDGHLCLGVGGGESRVPEVFTKRENFGRDALFLATWLQRWQWPESINVPLWLVLTWGFLG